MNTMNIINGCNLLIKSLGDDGYKKEAKTLKEILEDRFIWDQMAIQIIKKLNSLNRDGMSKKTIELIEKVISDLNPEQLFAYDRTIYGPVREFAIKLKENGLVNWQNKLDEAIAAGFTSTEIFMAIRYHLKGLFKDELFKTLPESLQNEAHRLYKLVKV